MTITETARRIAAEHNACGPGLTGGKLAFRADGSGGEWHSGDSWPTAEIIYPVQARPVTPESVQEWLHLNGAAHHA